MTDQPHRDDPETHALMAWYLDAGVDETIGETPVDRYRAQGVGQSNPKSPNIGGPKSPYTGGPKSAKPNQPGASDHQQAVVETVPRQAFQSALFVGGETTEGTPDTPLSGDAAVHSAYTLADAAQSVADLHAALEQFDGCALKKTATNLVFTDGSLEGRIVFVGEAPGAEEDRQGLPFVGPSGKLMDLMLSSIGLDRTQVLITNTVFWRPPGNRSPTTQEIAICLPFLERLIELVNPEILVAVGGPAASALLAQRQGITKLRGRWFSYGTPKMARPIPATAFFHPAYLLRSPGQKRESWRDLLAIRKQLDETG